MPNASVCYFYHAVSHNTVAVHISLLEFFRDDIVAQFLVLHMHHCIVKFRIEFLSDCLDRLYADAFQCCHELLVDLLHSLRKRT